VLPTQLLPCWVSLKKEGRKPVQLNPPQDSKEVPALFSLTMNLVPYKKQDKPM
jgi:hypothetical protein